MDKKEFYKKIDELVVEWYIDATPPCKGSYRNNKNLVPLGPHRRTNQKGEPNPVNETTGEVQIMAWKPVESFCERCCKVVEDRLESIDLIVGRIKCEKCGAKYPKKIHVIEAD